VKVHAGAPTHHKSPVQGVCSHARKAGVEQQGPRAVSMLVQCSERGWRAHHRRLRQPCTRAGLACAVAALQSGRPLPPLTEEEHHVFPLVVGQADGLEVAVDDRRAREGGRCGSGPGGGGGGWAAAFRWARRAASAPAGLAQAFTIGSVGGRAAGMEARACNPQLIELLEEREYPCDVGHTNQHPTLLNAASRPAPSWLTGLTNGGGHGRCSESCGGWLGVWSGWPVLQLAASISRCPK
jgi:hypothetical protein